MNALKVVAMRIRGTTSELEAAGEETDGVIESTSKLQAKIMALSGVNILNDDGSYKDTYTILYEIGQVYDSLSDLAQADLLESIAGKSRGSAVAAILQNYELLEDAYNTSLDADSSALKENEKYLDSISGKIDQFNNAVQTMWTNAIDSDVVKFFVDLGTILIKIVDDIGLLQSALIAIAAVSMIKNKQGPIAFFKSLIESGTEAINGVTNKVKSLKNIGTEINNLSNATAELTQAQLKEKLTSTGLTDVAAEEIVTKTKLGKVNDTLSASTLDAALREAGYSEEKRKSIIQRVLGTQATNENTDANNKNAASSQAAGAAEDKDTQDTRENIEATKQDTQATNENTDANNKNAASSVTLGQKIKNLGSSLGSFIKQNAKMLSALAATALVALVNKVVDWLVVSMDEADEAFDEATNKVKDLENEIDSLESQLDDINDQIAELTAQESLSFTDKEQLALLQAESAELQRQIDLNQTLQEDAAVGANSSAIEAAEKYTETGVESGKTTAERAGTGAIIGATAGGVLAGAGLGAAIGSVIPGLGTVVGTLVGTVISVAAGAAIGAGVGAAVGAAEEKVGERMDNMQDKLATLQEEYNTALANYQDDPTEKNKKKYEEAQEALNDYKSSMSEYMTQMDEYYQTIRDNWDQATTEQKEAAIAWADKMDAYAIAAGGTNAKANAINQVFTDGALMGKFEEEKEKIDEYVQALADGDESAAQSIADLINSNEALKDAFAAKTLDTQDVIDYFTQIGQEANYATLEGKTKEITNASQKLKSALSNVGQFMNGDSVDTVAIAEYFKGTSEATRTEIAKLVKQINDGELTVSQALKSFAAFGMAESWAIIEAEVSELNTDVFKDLGDEISGLIDTVSELSSAFEDVASSIDLISQAEAEMAYSGHLSVETALQLMESTDDWNSVLEIENGNIKLVEGAEEALVQTKLDLIKTNLQTALSTVEAQLAQLDATTSSADMAYTIEESTNLAVTQLAGNMAYLTEMMTAYTKAAAGENVDMSAVTDAAEAAKNKVLEATNYTKNAAEATGREDLEAQKAKLEAMLEMYETVGTASDFKKNYASDDVSGGASTEEEAEENALDDLMDKFDEAMEYWENRISANQAKYDQIQNEIDLLEKKGQYANEAYYAEQAALEEERLSLLEQQKAEAKTYLSQLEEGSDEWF